MTQTMKERKLECASCDYRKACDHSVVSYIPSCANCDHLKDEDGCDDCRGLSCSQNCNFIKSKLMLWERV